MYTYRMYYLHTELPFTSPLGRALLFGRDPRIPGEEILCQTPSPYRVDSDDYREELTDCLSTAWSLARENIKGAQDRKRKAYDKTTKEHQFRVEDRSHALCHHREVLEVSSTFSRTLQVLSVTPTNVEARLVDDPDAKSIFVAVNRWSALFIQLT